MTRVAIIAVALLLATTAAHAACRDMPENRRACMGDALRFGCVSMGIPAAVVCLQRNRRILSPDCSAAIGRCETRALNSKRKP